MVVDFRALNEKSIPDAYPLPSILEILDQLGSAKYFSVFDLKSGFHQIGMDESDAEKTAFSTPFGHYQFNRMPFGLRNAPATFQRLMDAVLAGLQGHELFVYLDDIVIYARSLSEHRENFDKLAKRLHEANLKLEPSKCGFLYREVAYLGHIISQEGVKPCPNKIIAVKGFPVPKTSKNIKEFLGLAGYYRRFIDKFSVISKPLTTLLRKDAKFVWGPEQERAFHALRESLCNKPVLQYPDFSQPFHITTDASNYAIGAILSQGIIGADRPVAYASRLLQGAELNYSTVEKECLAIVYAVQHFRSYVYGRRFTLITDHQPLVWMHSVRDPTSRLLRWRLKLAEYEYEMMYKAGKMNCNADALSRNPAVLPITSDSSNSPTSYTLFDPPSRAEPTPIHQESGPSSPELASSHPTDTSRIEVGETNQATPTATGLSPPTGIITTRDRLILRNDNLACFVTADNQPIDAGAMDLARQDRITKFNHPRIGRARVETSGPYKLITLPVKLKPQDVARTEDVLECLRSLFDVCTELGLATVSLSQTSVDDTSWHTIKLILIDLFSGTDTKIFTCSHEVRIPREREKEDIIKENHASAYAGHKGITKTYRRIREKYFWPSLKRDVTNYVTTCESCQLKKLTRVKTRQPMILTDTPGKAFDKVSIDIVGPLPTTAQGNTYILTMQDLLTKYSLAVPLRDITVLSTADAMINNLICRFGAPKAILSDQGRNFTGQLMKAIARKFKITHLQTSAFHPQSNGSLERSHHVLTEYLKQYVSRDNWDTWLNMAMFSYNTSVHEGTMYTPHELVYRRIARVPSATSYNPDTLSDTYNRYLSDLQGKINDTISKARENLKQAKARSKTYYDRKVNVKNFSAGDMALLLKEPRKGKFDDEYTGPHQILEILLNHNAKILVNGRVKLVHVNKLKKT